MPVPFAAYYSLALRRSAEDGPLQYAAPLRWFGEPGASHERLDQWLGNRMQRRLAANKTIHRDPNTGDIHVTLHQTDVASPELGAVSAQGTDADTWDDVIGRTHPLTYRERNRQVCVKLIAAKEGVSAPKDKK